jgi:hypothetical protein
MRHIDVNRYIFQEFVDDAKVMIDAKPYSVRIMATVKIVSGRTALQDKDRIERLNRAAQYIPVYAKLTDGTGNVSKTAYLHFELRFRGQPTGSYTPFVSSEMVIQDRYDTQEQATIPPRPQEPLVCLVR